MAEMEALKTVSKKILTVPAVSGENDKYLWDRACRFAANIENISKLDEIRSKNFAVDNFCLMASSYFCESGFVMYCREISKKMVVADVSPADLVDHTIKIVKTELGGILPGGKIDKINRIISESGNRFTEMPEAMILSDAKNLDDMGAVGIFNEFRRCAIHGKAVGEMVDGWKRKIDYGYWDARVKEGFHFEAVKVLAQRRFEMASEFMAQLCTENSGRDIGELILEAI